MGQDVYVDLYFLINASMDLLSLMIGAALLHRKVKRPRAALAAAFGGIYAVFSLLFLAGGVFGFLADCLAAVLIVRIAFSLPQKDSVLKKSRLLLKLTAVYVLVSMILGGIMTALYSLLNRLELPFESMQDDGLSVWLFALLTVAASIATSKGGRFLGFSQKTKSVTLSVILFGKPITLSALVDSGNLLRDPISGKSVILADLSALSSVLPLPLRRACESGIYTEWLSTYENSRKTRPVSAHTASGDTLLLAITPDRLTVTAGKDTYEADYLIAPARLGENAAGFDAVIPLD